MTRMRLIDGRPLVMAVTFDSSAGAAMGSTTCQPPSDFLSVVVSPDSDLMRSPSSLSDSTDARTFSSFATNKLDREKIRGSEEDLVDASKDELDDEDVDDADDESVYED